MKHRRNLLAAAGLAAMGAHPLAKSQGATRMRRVGILSQSTADASGHLYDSFKMGMRDLGWIEGQSIEYLLVYGQGKAEALDALGRDLVAQKVDVIVSTTEGIRAAQKATTTIPIVMASSSNAVQNRLVASLAKPGGNVTGISVEYETIVPKLFELLREVTPQARRIALLINETSLTHGVYWQAVEQSRMVLGIVPIRVTANSPQMLDAAFAQIAKERAQGLVVQPDVMFLIQRATLAKVAASVGLPAIYTFREHVLAGGLMCYGANLISNFRHAAKFADRILKGASPANLPVELPIKYDMVVNMKAARALGLSIPHATLLRANEVIE